LENFIKPKIFNDAVKNLTIYSNSKDEFGNLREIYLKKGSGENFQITFAKEGRFKEIGKAQFLELKFGETISVIDDKITNFKFKKTDFNLSNFEDNTTTYKKTQEVATMDLVKCYHNLMGLNFLKIDQDFKVENCNADNIDNILKELYKRIIIPLYIPVLILISLLLIFKSKENINYPRYRILIFLIGFSTLILSEMTIRLIKEDFLENLKFVLIPLVLIVSLYSNYLFRFKEIKALK
jgi:lipopolysaccharide export system permease protein